jgi:hypothetical protein
VFQPLDQNVLYSYLTSHVFVPLEIAFDCIIKKPEKDVCRLTRTPRSFSPVTGLLHAYSSPCNGNGDCFVMDTTEGNREVCSVFTSTKMVFLDIFG